MEDLLENFSLKFEEDDASCQALADDTLLILAGTSIRKIEAMWALVS
jgi:hypothetical protein